MATLDDETEHINLLYWSGYGVGKTTASAAMARLGVVKYIRPDKGLKARALRQLGIPTDKIEPIDNFSPVSLEENIDEWREMLAEKPDCLAGVVLDTMTEWIARRIEVQIDHDWEVAKAQARRDRIAIDPLTRYTAGDGRDQYKAVTQEGRRIARHLYDLPCHVIYTAQTRRDVDQSTGVVTYGPDMNPALQGDVIGYCDLVIELVPDGSWPDGRSMVVGYPKPVVGRARKDRYGHLPSRIADPTFDRVLGYVAGTLVKDTDPVQAEYREILKKREKEDEL